MSQSDFKMDRRLDYNPDHVPWWHRKGYHERDLITMARIRPSTKLKKMNCSHFMSMSSYLHYRKNNIDSRFYNNPGLPCPICKRVIPEHDLSDYQKKKYRY